MNQLEEVQSKAKELKLDFMLMGGLAVIEHGFARFTNDIDLMVRRSAAAEWSQILQGLGYRLFHDGGNFHQYERKMPDSWPLDLMLAQDPTFDGLLEVSIPRTVMGVAIRMVSLNHLIALKLHVIKQGKMHRFLDDLTDVIELVRINRLDLQTQEYRDLFLKYGTADLYDKIQRLSKS